MSRYNCWCKIAPFWLKIWRLWWLSNWRVVQMIYEAVCPYSLFLLQMFFARVLYNYIRMDKNHLSVKLTQEQELLFSTLKDYKQALGLTTVMRVAGGWVRDKIMGLESHDIDIALDDCKGEEFVLKLKHHAETKNEKISSFGVTKFNPELSKHLETATARIHGLNIDFVNLRSESYNEDSRIPQIEMGTPLTDALRRDFTINSLFYNIDTAQVEDWTEKGISDIYNKIIRTPLDPLVTFKDDPLRVLRCFRFKSRFNFKVDEDIYKSLSNNEVHDALKLKVSKERIGIELAGMLKAKHPLIALEEILRFGFWNIIFSIPENSDLKSQQYIEKIPEIGFRLISTGLESLQQNGLRTEKDLIQEGIKDKRPRYSPEDFRVLIELSFLMLPYNNFKAPEGKKWTSLTKHIALNELKYSKDVAQFVHKVGELTSQLENILSVGQTIPFEVRVVRWLRQAEEKWQIVIHCLHVLRAKNQELKLEMQPLSVRQWIFEHKLEDSYLVHAFIDGNFVNKRGKKGPVVRIILENATLWRILHPQASEQQFLEFYDKEPIFFESEKSYN